MILRDCGLFCNRWLTRSQPFTIQTAGLGIFTGQQPVLYLAVIRSIELSTYHQALWEALGELDAGYSFYYRPDGPWMPHITLAQWDIDAYNLPAIIGSLCERPLTWEIMLDNLALFVEGTDGRYSCERFDFGL